MMKYLKYTLIIVAMLILLTFLTVKVYFYYDVPRYSGTQVLVELQDSVEVFTDSYGVPHIFAKNNEDLFFTAGYIIAREQLFQLSLLAAVASGEISRLLGDGYNKHDDYIKQNNPFLLSNDSLSTINYENELLIKAYCSGINTWIDETGGMLPPSFKILNTKPLKWTPSNAFNVVAMMTSNIYQNRQEEWFLNTIGQYFGETKLLEILTAEKYFSIDSINKSDLDLENQIWELVGASGSLLQNDVMIVPPKQTAFQKPILILEDTWGLQQQGKWYDIHLNGGDFNIEGALVYGFPMPLVGKKDNTVWAFTGQVTAETINKIFEIANREFNLNQNTIFDFSLSYSDTTGLYSNQKEHSPRFKLLHERLVNLEKININDIIDRLYETNNPRKTETAHTIAKIYLENALSNKLAMNMLKDWDGSHSEMAAEVLLINVIYTKLLKNIFIDEFSLVGKDVFDIFIRLPILAEQSINMVLNNNESSWIDDIKTVVYQERLVEIVIKSVDEAINEIENDFGNNILSWQLEQASPKTYKNNIYGKSFLTKLFNLNIGLGVSYNSNDQISGTAPRRIFDLSDMNTSYSTLPTGHSGLPQSFHYENIAGAANKHGFRKIEFDETVIRNDDKYQKLVLYPTE